MVNLPEIIQSHQRIERFIHRTPVITNYGLDQLTGAYLFFKCENFQKAGAFKIRGATNAVERLTEEELQKGIATASSGNHGAHILASSLNNHFVSVGSAGQLFEGLKSWLPNAPYNLVFGNVFIIKFVTCSMVNTIKSGVKSELFRGGR